MCGCLRRVLAILHRTFGLVQSLQDSIHHLRGGGRWGRGKEGEEGEEGVESAFEIL